MLTTILYRSHLYDHVPIKTLEDMVGKANKKTKFQMSPAFCYLMDGISSSCLKGPIRPFRAFTTVSAATPAITIWWN